MDSSRHGAAWTRAAFLALFFVSGFSALVYQVIWQRMLTLFGGADVHSVSIIVSAFMAGLGLGAAAGGHLADRLRARACAVAFAMSELAVGIFALFSTTIYYDALYLRLGAWAIPGVALWTIVFGVTLWPTFLMGMSLPLGAKAFSNGPRPAHRWIAVLYGWNTVGAACGSLFAVTVLFPQRGLAGGVRFGAALSIACSLAAFAIASRLEDSEGNTTSQLVPREVKSESRGYGVPGWLAIYLVSGFVAMSLEVVWFRVLGVILKSTASTFGYMLAVYVGGVGLGSLLSDSARVRAWRPASGFLLLQAAAPVCAALSLVALIGAMGALGGRMSNSDRHEIVSTGDSSVPALDVEAAPALQESTRLRWDTLSGPVALAVRCAIPLWLIGPPTIMMGLSFGLLQRAVQTDVRAVGRLYGWLQAANIVGAVLGVFITGLVLLDWVGSAGTLRLVVCCGGVFMWLHLWAQGHREGRLRAAFVGAVAIVGTVVLIPSNAAFWAGLHAAPVQDVLASEDRSGVSLLRSYADTGETQVYANGLGQSRLPYGGIHTVLGALPALLHQAPETIAVVGLGSGDTAFAVGGRAETRRIDSIEIIAPELATLRALNRVQLYPGLRTLLGDQRIRHVFGDGRTYLRRSEQRFDIIETDALEPTRAYAGNLYSVEFFELLRERLAPGGYAVTWAPTERVRDSMVRAFPYVLAFDDIAIGSSGPVLFDRSAVLSRMRSTFTRGYYAAGGVDIDELLLPRLAEEPVLFGPDFDRKTLTDVNMDLFPRDEFAVPRMH